MYICIYMNIYIYIYIYILLYIYIYCIHTDHMNLPMGHPFPLPFFFAKPSCRQVWGWAVAILDNDHDIWSLVFVEDWEDWGSYPRKY